MDFSTALLYFLAQSWIGGFRMLRTIIMGSCVSVQGILEKTLPDGRLVVRVGQRLFTGLPVAI
ncbi:hypothetical protein ACFQ4E_00310 [Litorisediminicola beolgyonensis]|uniref:Uncharacterized protein n=1 Tax=Litorisediminicola beolgyonensis TaxID=1173614 RepID=A0ABW3ZCF0_9RHOB